MITTPPEVHDHKSAVRFVQWCVEQIGLGYPPDTPFTDYVDGAGRAVFSPTEAARLDNLADRAFEHCDPYEIGHGEFQRLLHEGGHQTV